MNTIGIKQVVAGVLYNIGAVRVLSNGYRNGIIVSYHHILPRGDELIDFLQSGMYVTTETFEQHIHFLMQHYDIRPLDSLDHLSSTKTCIITFDDGWADNYTHAFPILQRYQVPATIFVATNQVDTTEWPWPDRISYYLKRSPHQNLQEIYKVLRQSGVVNTDGDDLISDQNKLDHAVEFIISCLKLIPHTNLIGIIKEIDHALQPFYKDLQSYRPWLSWDEIQMMHRHGISFGAHTHNHVILTNSTITTAQEEIITSKETLAKYVGEPVKLFSYPNGNYNDAIVNILRQQGLTHAVTTRSGSIEDSEDFLTLRRVMLHEDMTSTIPMLACRLTGRIPFF